MSASDDYIRRVLARYVVATGPNSPPVAAGQALYPWISRWAGAALNDVRFSGSYAKGTAVRGTTDVDLFISLKADTSGTLRDIYWDLYRSAEASNLAPRAQNVSVGTTIQGVSVDLIPGRLQQGYTHWHSLYRRRKDSWTQTNIDKHIQLIGQSGRLEEIRAVKVWRSLSGLDWPSFYLELTVLAACGGRLLGDLANNVWRVFQYIRDNLTNTRVVDPSNSNNYLSDELTMTEKEAIVAAGRNALAQDDWAKILW